MSAVLVDQAALAFMPQHSAPFLAVIDSICIKSDILVKLVGRARVAGVGGNAAVTLCDAFPRGRQR